MKSSILLLSLFTAMLPSLTFADAALGKAVFDRTCTPCHGPEGKGDGPIAAALPPEQKPRNFIEGKYRYATDKQKMKELITKGGMAFGMSPIMAAIPLPENELDAVAEYVLSLKK